MNDEEQVITIQTKESLKHKIAKFFANPKKRLIFIIVCGVVLIAAVGVGLYLLSNNKPGGNNVAEKNVDLKQQEIPKFYNMLDGTETDAASVNRHPLGVMIENHIDARPQAGLDKASLVYEAIAEGGITRFLALYSSKEADKVGPVRSVRTYFIDWALGYNAYLAHVGGNYDALEQIPSDNVLDLDQFKHSSSYWREPKAGVATEHTMFSSTVKLREQAQSLGYTTDTNFRSYKFYDTPLLPTDSSVDSAAPAVTSANKINVNFSSQNYNVVFDYDATNNVYKRVVNGKVQTDREDSAEIAPTNLVVMTVSRTPTVTKINEPGYNMGTVGQGVAKFFIGGMEVDGKWVKGSKTSREIFYDNNGNEITFNRGQFWICVIPPESSVTFQ